ncbi:MAG: multi-copper polyphenol oxidoreductase [Gammaproteobacteria bacterium]|nr:multi-copper polyphenol oxidoreductase [Gammaproteobacteria bacterium]
MTLFDWPGYWLTMQIDYPSMPAQWVTPQDNLIGLTTTNEGLQGRDGTMATSQAGLSNRERLCEALARVNTGRRATVQWVRQTHGVANVYASAMSTNHTPVADAVWTDQAGIALAVQTADCVPVLFAHRRGELVAAAHAGWRGLIDGVIDALISTLPAEPEELQAWIGPCISVNHFEVGRDVWGAVQDLCPEAVFEHPRDAAKRLVDLVLFTRRRLHNCGVVQIAAAGRCTYADPVFYSHRQTTVECGAQATTGRMASVVMLKNG